MGGQYWQSVAQLSDAHSSLPRNAQRRRCFGRGAGETPNVTTKPFRFQPASPALAPAAECRKGADLALPAHLVGAGGLQLPSPADLLGLCRRGDCPLWSLGWRLDDASTAVALPSLRHLGHRQRTSRCAAGGAVVPALALWTLARRQRTVTGGPQRNQKKPCQGETGAGGFGFLGCGFGVASVDAVASADRG